MLDDAGLDDELIELAEGPLDLYMQGVGQCLVDAHSMEHGDDPCEE